MGMEYTRIRAPGFLRLGVPFLGGRLYDKEYNLLGSVYWGPCSP